MNALLQGNIRRIAARRMIPPCQHAQKQGNWGLVERSHATAGRSLRLFSDRMMGFSPMAPSAPVAITPTTNPDGTVKRIPTAQDVSTSGGVWAPTSAKRDKLAELKTALEEDQETLDDAATPDQALDLYLADGVGLIAKTTDSIPDVDTKEIQDFSEWLVEQQGKMPEEVDEMQFSAHLSVVSEKINTLLSVIPPSQCLKDVRDYYDPANCEEEELSKIKPGLLEVDDANFSKAVLRFRLILTNAAIDHLKDSWAVLTTVSDGDVDRAATKGVSLEAQAKTVTLAKIYKYLFAHTSGTCSERVDAAWEIMDRDEDGLMDEGEMNTVAFLCVKPVQSALDQIFEEALDAYPIRAPLPEPDEDDPNAETLAEKPKGWRQRRREAKLKKNLLKLFQKATKNYFEDEVEINHRLRCIYAWAEKEHQGNQLDSVMVEEGWTGKKRYVELSPKISLPEFREVQQEHFTHLDRIGSEILKGYREDLWVMQGKGRERRELIRDCLAFLTVVSVVDYIILAL